MYSPDEHQAKVLERKKTNLTLNRVMGLPGLLFKATTTVVHLTPR